MMEENIDLLLNIKENQSICWKEEFITDARTTTEPSLTSTRLSRPQVSSLFYPHLEYVMYLIALLLCRWQAHNSLLEEKRRQDHARYSQAQITSSLKTHRHQEKSRQSLRW